MPTIDEYKELKHFGPTTVVQIAENIQNNSRLGLTSIMILSFATNLLGAISTTSGNDISFNKIGKYSYTNLEISNVSDKNYNIETYQNIESGDYYDFGMKPIYTNEFNIKVKSFKMEKFMPTSF